MVKIISGNLLDSEDDYIVQQCCCTACKPHGLSSAIAAKYPYANAYSLRTPVSRGKNTAKLEDRAIPGTCAIFGDGAENRYVACLFAQQSPGKPGKYDSFGVPDTREDREKYFRESLAKLSELIPAKCTIGFPYGIGCGLAGGNWQTYLHMISEWEKTNPGYIVTIYKLE